MSDEIAVKERDLALFRDEANHIARQFIGDDTPRTQVSCSVVIAQALANAYALGRLEAADKLPRKAARKLLTLADNWSMAQAGFALDKVTEQDADNAETAFIAELFQNAKLV